MSADINRLVPCRPKKGATVSVLYRCQEPDTWSGGAGQGKCWTGKVLDVADPRAWEGTIAFPGRLPTRAQVNAHISNLQKKHGLSVGKNDVPVLWEFGKVYWTSRDSIHCVR